MWRSVLINLMAVALVIGAFATIPVFVGPDLPRLNQLVIQALAALFVIGWLILMLRPVPPHGVGRVAWPFSSPFVVWGGIVLLGGGHWLWMPYADEGVLLACIICQICTVTLYVMTTIEPPPSRGRTPLAPLALPISIAVYLAVFPSRFSLPLGLFVVAYAITIQVMQRYVQRQVDEAYAARRAAEAAQAQAAAERDAKTRFLTSASHDLGQPLQAARLSFDQVQRATDPAARAKAAKRVDWALDATEGLLQRMLDHLRLDSGAVKVDARMVSVGPLIARLAELHEPAARLAGTQIVVMPSRLKVVADPQLLERCLNNLVTNAVRHAKANRILIGARRQGDRVGLWVIDDGTGIPSADQGRLFDDYVQGSNHGDEVRGGFGLGLASARRMARLMGGDVALDPRWRAGSAFRVDLPGVGAKFA
jgi:signal transduction histidine kinase